MNIFLLNVKLKKQKKVEQGFKKGILYFTNKFIGE
jgi:hypothetical protein